MKSKFTFTALTIGITLLQAGFFSHDKAYYDAHPKEAEAKYKLCNKAIEVALGKGDMALAEKYDKDKECREAKKAYVEHRSALRKAVREAEEKKVKQEKAKKVAAFKAEYEKQLQTFKRSEYDTFMAMGSQGCAHYYPIGIAGANQTSKDAKCKAWKELEPIKNAEQIDRLLNAYPGEKLFAYRDKVCQGNPYGDPKCDIARMAVEKEFKRQTQAYLADKAKLKHDFNACFKQIKALQIKGKYNQASQLQKSYRCMMPAKAAIKLNIYGYFQPMK